jgi:hypothetical protein
MAIGSLACSLGGRMEASLEPLLGHTLDPLMQYWVKLLAWELRLIETYNADNVIFELDSLIVVNAVKNQTPIR